ncbi:MAG: putative Na+/H+ antiporter [Spirochaetia bacterium]|nr:putative Na+/H+ antiporter [Spirochaetia bacterium]
MLKIRVFSVCILMFLSISVLNGNELSQSSLSETIPKSLDSYDDSQFTDVYQILANRISKEPFNLAASIIFLMAILHSFTANKFMAISHKLEKKHQARLAKQEAAGKPQYSGYTFDEVDFKAHIFHFLGEVEAIFGIWVVILAGAFVYYFNWDTFLNYIGEKVSFNEPMFVVIIMTLASARPIVRLSERILEVLANLGRKSPAAWWFTILSVGPLLGSVITEPGAMTISALLLAKQFYDLKPRKKFAYATIGLLFVNVSVGGTLSHFAAPPVLMVAGKWGWGLTFMLTHIGWKAVIGILINNLLYLLLFAKEFSRLEKKAENIQAIIHWDERREVVPIWVTFFHVFFMAWTVINAHHTVLFIGGFLFYLGFFQATLHHQNRNNLRGPVMVGFFLSALVIHGGLQGWWLAPVLNSLTELPLMIGASILTSFNDNAAITYLSSLVPNLSDSLKYSVMVGAVTGGGLTVIANAPNPAGQSILGEFFENGVSPLGLFGAAIIPTIIVGCCFMLL